jgi:hypothetical protein
MSSTTVSAADAVAASSVEPTLDDDVLVRQDVPHWGSFVARKDGRWSMREDIPSLADSTFN